MGKDLMPEVNSEKEEKGLSYTPKVSKLKNKSGGIPVIIFILSIFAVASLSFMITNILVTKKMNQKFNNYLSSEYGNYIYTTASKINTLNSLIESEAIYELDQELSMDYMVKGYMVGLDDKYAEYYTAEEYQSLQDSEAGKMEGIGVSVYYDSEKGGVCIAEIVKDSPAEEAGIEQGDLIMYVLDDDGEYYSVASYGYSIAMSKLRGTAGTEAKFILYKKNENYSTPHKMSVERKHIVTSTVYYHVHESDDSVGIIRISSFGQNTPDEFISAVTNLQNQGVTSFIFDVRNNPGGELNSVGKTLDFLLPEGPIIRTTDKNNVEEVVYQSDSTELDAKMVVVCNGVTASAGELFTAALMDYKKAVSIGTKTYGKGCMQTIKNFADGTAIKYTNRYYCPPFSDNYDGIGITPNIIVELSEKNQQVSIYSLSDIEDEQIAAAYNQLKK